MNGLHPLAEAAVRMEALHRLPGWMRRYEWEIHKHQYLRPEPILVNETPMVIERRWPHCTYQRNAQIVDYREQHFRMEEIADWFGISRQRVYQILREDREKRERLRRELFDFRDDRSIPLVVVFHRPDLEKPYDRNNDWVRYEVTV